MPFISSVRGSYGTIGRMRGSGFAGLYAFVNATFTPGGTSGRNGPLLAAAITGISGTGIDVWKNNTLYFNVTNGIQYWTVPATASYIITAAGAMGGFSDDGPGGNTRPGYGATVSGTFNLTSGQILKILVGQKGLSVSDPTSYPSNAAGGGGGGSFVATSSNVPLIVAAGGGGEHWTSWNTNGIDGKTGNNGDIGGAAGARCSGGGGFTNNGSNAASEVSSTGGLSFLNGGTGGLGDNSMSNQNVGGFGGGGGAKHEGGGGGGYSGGYGVPSNDYDTNYSTNSTYQAGSYNSGTNTTGTNGNNNGNGYVSISLL